MVVHTAGKAFKIVRKIDICLIQKMKKFVYYRFIENSRIPKECRGVFPYVIRNGKYLQ